MLGLSGAVSEVGGDSAGSEYYCTGGSWFATAKSCSRKGGNVSA